MKKLVVDIETNGLLFDADKVWCISILDTSKGVQHIQHYNPANIKEAIAELKTADRIIGHNWAAYDAVILEKLYGFKFDSTKVIDTMLLSNILDPDRGSHSLAAYGEELGIKKPEHEDWSQYSDEMAHRNKEDVRITYQVFNSLNNRAAEFGKDIIKWLQVEQDFGNMMAWQEHNGWYIDEDRLNNLIAEIEFNLNMVSYELVNRLPLFSYQIGVPVKAYNKNGSISMAALKFFDNDASLVCGDFSKVGFKKLDLGSHAQVKEYLTTLGWKPTEWNFKKDANGRPVFIDGERVKTSPKITEDSLESLDSDIGKIFARRFMLSHRLSYLTGEKGLRSLLRKDKRIGAGCFSCATNTARVRHYGIVNVCSINKPYGKEIRALFSCPQNRILVGADLSALENRIAGHYTYPHDGGEYIKRLTEEDPHQYIADKLNITRTLGKKLNYAILYGATVSKVRETLESNEQYAKQVLEGWWEANPALSQVKEDIYNFIFDKGHINTYNKKLKDGAYILAIDGRPIYLRSMHSAINALFQSAGSICNKMVTIELTNYCKQEIPSAFSVGNFHDENNWEINACDKDKFKELFDKACAVVTDKLKLNIPLIGEVKYGRDWSETH